MNTQTIFTTGGMYSAAGVMLTLDAYRRFEPSVEVFNIDVGYCIDAPACMCAGSMTNFRNQAIQTNINRDRS